MATTLLGLRVPEALVRGTLFPPLLFVLVSQNLTVNLNKALSLDLVPGFNKNLSSNFNHLMFADDIIFVIKAFSNSARNCVLCLIFIKTLLVSGPTFTNQPSLFLPGIIKKLANSISRILGINLGNFPFTYLGIPISPRRLTIN